jgi:hypothetical protein
VSELESLVIAHPLRERMRGLLMLALYRCGRRADALEAYPDGRARSVEELGLEPGPALRALQAQILDDAPELAPPRGVSPAARRTRRLTIALLAAGVLLAGAALGALLREDEPALTAARPALDVAPNSVVALDPSDGRARLALPLPGRPTDLAASGDRVYAVSIDSSALTIADARTGRLERTIPLSMRPAAVAVAGEEVWVADGRRGLLVRLAAGYERILTRARWRRPAQREAVGLSRLESTGVALAAGAA